MGQDIRAGEQDLRRQGWNVVVEKPPRNAGATASHGADSHPKD